MSQPQSNVTHSRPPHQERRKFPRFRVRGKLLGYLVETDRPVRIRDISFGGFATETVEPLSIGRVEKVLFTARDDKTAMLDARSMHSWPSCADDGSPCYVTGFSFVDGPTTRGDVGKLLEVVTATTLYRDE